MTPAELQAALGVTPTTSDDEARQAARGKVAYKPGDESAAELDAHLRQKTPHIGLWLDTSEQTVDETVDELLARAFTEAEV